MHTCFKFLMKSSLPILSLVAHTFSVKSKSIAKAGVMIVFSNRFMVLALTFRSLIHFELNFVHEVRVRVQLHYFACGCPVVPAPSVEESIFFPIEWSWHPWQNHLAIDV